MNVKELASYVETLLAHSDVTDASQNGIQVAGASADADVRKICSAVDAGLTVLEEAARRGAQMLFVHHGLLWGRSLAIDGAFGDKVRLCIERGVTLFASHLPLDTHAEFGNSVVLAEHFGLHDVKPGFVHTGTAIGVTGLAKARDRDELVTRAETLLGSAGARMLPFGPQLINRVGIVSGGTSTLFDYPELKTVDLLITGEARQSNFHDALEHRINLLFVGHYASETVGVRALGEHLRARFGIEHEFIDIPTGI